MAAVVAPATFLVDAVIGPGLMFLYPLYLSVRAIFESLSKSEQGHISGEEKERIWKQRYYLLTYWILYSFIALFELSFSKILQRLPLWPYVKLVFCVWLLLPCLDRKVFTYDNFVTKLVSPYVASNESSHNIKADIREIRSLAGELTGKVVEKGKKRLVKAMETSLDYVNKKRN